MTYKANKKVWMMQEMSASWLRKFDEDIVAEKQWVILILDNCAAHNGQPKLIAVNLTFFPSNTTAKCQPLDQGVIATVMALYRKHICKRVLLDVQQHEPLKVNLRGAIDMAVCLWWQFKAITISMCFAHNAEAFKADEQRGFVDETVNTDNMWLGCIDRNFVSATDTFKTMSMVVRMGWLSTSKPAPTMRLLPWCAGAQLRAPARSKVGLATKEGLEDENNEDSTPEMSSKEVLKCLNKLKMHSRKTV